MFTFCYSYLPLSGPINVVQNLCFQGYYPFQLIKIYILLKQLCNTWAAGGFKIRIIPAEARYYRDKGWVKSYFLLSYSDYYDPKNLNFGSLRAFNEFILEPGKGFSSHPHAEVEITTIVLEGEITHEDNMGNRGVLGKEEVQCITTGRGIEHSEFNRGKEPLRFYQIWISPYKNNLEPTYSKMKFEPSGWKNRLLPLASGQGFEDALKINADATVYRASLEKENKLHFNSKEGRFVFIYISTGELSVNGQSLGRGDQARFDEEETIHLETATFAELVLIDVPVNHGNI